MFVDTEDIFESSSGSMLCSALVKTYDASQMKPLEQYYQLKLSVVGALKALLTISQTAKHTALEGNLCITYIELTLFGYTWTKKKDRLHHVI